MQSLMEAQTTTTLPDRGMPSAALRLLFLSIEEVMGAAGIKAVLNGAKLSTYINNYPENTIEYGVTFGEYGKVEQAVEDFLGPRGARAILIRVGRELFRYSLREQSALLGIAGNALKNMPLISQQAKMKILLQQIVAPPTRPSINPRGWKKTKKRIWSSLTSACASGVPSMTNPVASSRSAPLAKP